MAGSKPLHGRITHSVASGPVVRPVLYQVTIVGTVLAGSPAEGKELVFKNAMDVSGNIPGATDLFVTLRRASASGVSPRTVTQVEKQVRQHRDKRDRPVAPRKPRRKKDARRWDKAAAAASKMNKVMTDWEWADMNDVDRRFHNNLMNLTKEERVVVAHRFGLNGVQPMKPETVKNMFNLNQYKYKHLLATGLLKLGLKGFKKGIKVIPASELRNEQANLPFANLPPETQ